MWMMHSLSDTNETAVRLHNRSQPCNQIFRDDVLTCGILQTIPFNVKPFQDLGNR
jgi:hypothetical protein